MISLLEIGGQKMRKLPQEHGHKTDIRWLSLCNLDGQGIKVKGFPLLEFSTSHFSAKDHYQVGHTHELPPRTKYGYPLTLPCEGSGRKVLAQIQRINQYRLVNSRYQLKFTIELISNK